MRRLTHSLGVLTLSIGMLTACQSHLPAGVSLSAQRLIQALAEQDQTTVYRSAYQSSSQAAFQVRLDATQAPFQTLVSQPGIAGKTFADVLAYRVFLVNSATALTGTVTPYAGNVFTINSPSASQTVIFDNVPPGSYYACAAAFKSSSSFEPANNLADTDLHTLDYTEGRVACSEAGGMGSGRLTIDAAYQVTGTASLQINLNLQKAIGASIGSSITVSNGL